MANLTRKQLKSDKFAEEVGHSIEYVAGHRRQAGLWAGGALAVLIIGGGIYFWRSRGADTRQQALATALETRGAIISATPTPGDPRPTFPNKETKVAAEKKAFQEVATKYAGSDEAATAEFELGMLAADEGNLAEAAKHFETVISSGSKEFAASAKLSLAQVYEGTGKIPEAQKLLQSLIDSPTALVSKEQATIAMARLLAKTKPAEARKLLEPLEKDTRQSISRNAMSLLAEIPVR